MSHFKLIIISKEYEDINELLDSYEKTFENWIDATVGGIYGNYLVGKDGSVGNSFKIKDIDFEETKIRREKEACEIWEKRKHDKNDFPYWDGVGMKKEEYQAFCGNFGDFSFIIDDEWIDRFSGRRLIMSNVNKDWVNKTKKIIETLDPNDVMTVVDCQS